MHNYNSNFTDVFDGPAMEASAEALLSFAYGGIAGIVLLAVVFFAMVVFSALKERAQTRRFQEVVPEVAPEVVAEEEITEVVAEEEITEVVAEEEITEVVAEEITEEIECLSAEDISAQDLLDGKVHVYNQRKDGEYRLSRSMVSCQDKVQADVAPILEIHDNVVYLDEAYKPEMDVQVMESEGVTLKDTVQMSIWSCRRGFRAMVKFVKDMASAPARIRELEAEIAKLKDEKNFNFDFYSEDDDEVVTWVNKA